jgi:hypothetical protein
LILIAHPINLLLLNSWNPQQGLNLPAEQLQDFDVYWQFNVV